MIESKEGLLFVWPIRGHFLLLCCCRSTASWWQEKQCLDYFFKATKCVVGQAIRVFPYVSLLSECFGLFWLIIKKMMDSSQLIVIRGMSTMVLLISSCAQFLTLKVAVTLTLTLIVEIGTELRVVILHL